MPSRIATRIAPVVQAVWSEVASLDETARGAGGFGSTGASASAAAKAPASDRGR